MRPRHADLVGGVGVAQLFVPMHYHEVNRLTFPAFDPYSRQPSYKAGAVAVRPLESPSAA